LDTFRQQLAQRTGASLAGISATVVDGVVTFSFTAGDVSAYNAATLAIASNPAEEAALGVSGMAALNASPTPTPTDPAPNTGLIVGVTLGGLAVLIAIVAIGINVTKKRRSTPVDADVPMLEEVQIQETDLIQ
jgi:hypothetical protein